MDHPFLSKRIELDRARAGVALASDVRWLSRLTEHDKVQARREPEIADEKVRDVVLRHAQRLGMLLDDLDAAAGGTTTLAATYGAAWSAFWRDGTPMSRAFQEAVETTARTMQATVDTLSPVEADAGSSSYSDYSDSETESTKTTEDDEEEESSEEEKKPAKKKK